MRERLLLWAHALYALMMVSCGAVAGTISGVITSTATGLPIVDGYVHVYNAGGASVGLAFPANDGTYTYSGLAAGSYFARTEGTGFYDELWNNVPCAQKSCTPTTGTQIVVTSEGTTTANFSLANGSAISGVLTSATSGLPLVDGYVHIYNAGGASLGLAFPGNDGMYVYNGLAAGSYFARTEATGFYDELWNNLSCAQKNCTPTAGTPILVADSGTTVANFSLTNGGAISGTLTSTTSGLPIVGGYVHVYNSGGSSLGLAFPGSDGAYTYGGLAPGNYFARTEGTGASDELWDNFACPQKNCVPTSGTPILVSTGVAIANFFLATGATISGTLTAAGSGLPIVNGYVHIYNSGGTSLGLAFPDTSGTYSYGGLSAGSYYVRTEGTGYYDELWDNVPCPQKNCSATAGTPITVASSGAVIANFTLNSGGRISGNLTSAAAGLPIANGYVHIYSSGGVSLGLALPGNDGSYTYGGLATDSYFARTEATGSKDELWKNIPCLQGACVVTNGTPIPVVEGATTEIRFLLDNDIFGDGFE